METLRLARWTRRRLGAIAWSAIAASAVLFEHNLSAAKKKRRKKKRCKKLLSACSLSGRKCCNGDACEEADPPGQFLCCKPTGKACGGDEECCPGNGCFEGECKLA